MDGKARLIESADADDAGITAPCAVSFGSASNSSSVNSRPFLDALPRGTCQQVKPEKMEGSFD